MRYLRLLTGHEDPKLSKIEIWYRKKNAEGSAKEFNDEIIEDEYDGNEDAWLNDGNAQACSVVSLDIQFPTPDYGVKEYFFTFRAVIDGVDYEGQCHSDLFCGVKISDCMYDYASSKTINDELAQLVGWDGVLELIEYAHVLWEEEPPAKEKKRHIELLANAWPSKHKPKQTH
jgi:hypothetical protein